MNRTRRKVARPQSVRRDERVTPPAGERRELVAPAVFVMGATAGRRRFSRTRRFSAGLEFVAGEVITRESIVTGSCLPRGAETGVTPFRKSCDAGSRLQQNFP